MQAILDAIQSGGLRARIAIVLSDNPEGYILERARKNGIPAEVIDCAPHKTKFPEEIQKETAEKLKRAGVELVCLAGFMRLVKRPLLDAYPSKILNIHPSLLPAFPGIAAWAQAVDAGVSETGVTVHVVDSGMDTGPVVIQRSVAIEPSDTPQSLHERIQVVEHEIYPEAISIYATQLEL